MPKAFPYVLSGLVVVSFSQLAFAQRTDDRDRGYAPGYEERERVEDRDRREDRADRHGERGGPAASGPSGHSGSGGGGSSGSGGGGSSGSGGGGGSGGSGSGR
jgi:hypothetical protein